MKKILILAYDFPPYVSVGGLRPYSWYKYFHEFGFYPVVVTRQWRNRYGNYLDYIAPGESKMTIIEESETGTIIRTPYKPNLANRILLKCGERKLKYVRKLVSAFYEIFQWVFYIGPKSGLYHGAKKYLSENKVDCIIATGDPFVLFKYAEKLSRKFEVPWIADYRDLWNDNTKWKKSSLLSAFNKLQEKRCLKNCSFITCVSDLLKVHIAATVGNKDFQIITNGFDDLIRQQVDIDQNSEELVIAFVGTLYPWHPWYSFLEVVSAYQKTLPLRNIKVKFYGVNLEEAVKNAICSDFRNLFDKVVFYPKMQNQELGKELAAANVFLLFNDYAVLGTKIYDYLALERLILLCYTDDKEALKLKKKYYTLNKMEGLSNSLQADVIEKTNSGIAVMDSFHLYEVIRSLCSELTQKGYIECNSTGVEQYSRKKQIEKLTAGIHEKLSI